jgi:hypothetical protein
MDSGMGDGMGLWVIFPIIFAVFMLVMIWADAGFRGVRSGTRARDGTHGHDRWRLR